MNLLVGYGEIGKAVKKVFKDMKVYDPLTHPKKPKGVFDILLVAIPYSDKFVEIVRHYQKEYQIESTLVFSTVPVGTCHRIDASHCPIEGKHPDLAKSIRLTDKWLGGPNKYLEKFLKQHGFKVFKVVP